MSVRYAASLLSSYPLSPRFSRWMNRPACHPCFPHLPVCGVGWPIHKFTWTVPHGMFCDLGVSDVIDREPPFHDSSATGYAPPSFHEYPVSDISVKMKFRWKISVVHFVGKLVCTVILVSEWTSGDIELRCRIFQASKQVVLLWPQNSVSSSQKWLAECYRIGAISSLFRLAK